MQANTHTETDRPQPAGRWRIRTGWAVAASLAVIASGIVFPPPASAAASPSYVALGDSYAAGQAIGGAAGTHPSCLQSVENYPRVAARAAGLDLVDVSCTGATIPDLFAPKGDLPAQTDALSASTSVVTLTMGGNDLGFGPVLSSCLAVSADGPILSGLPTCRDKYIVGGVDTLSAKVTTQVAPALGDAVKRIRAKAPNARVVVVGYPTLMPDAGHTRPGGCFSPLSSSQPSLPFTTVDLAYINSVQATLDAQSQAVTLAAGAEYVSLVANTFEHSVCSPVPYISGIQLSGLSLRPESMHPNVAGLAFVGNAVSKVLQAPAGFQGVTGRLVSQGGDRYDLQIVVPSATLFSTPDVAAEKNGSYIANVNGEHGWYVWAENVGDTRVYHASVTVKSGDVVRLRTASGAVQVLTPSA